MKHVLTAAALAVTLGLALPASAQLSSTTPTTNGTPGGTQTTEHAATVKSSQMVSDNPSDINANKPIKKHKKAAASGSGMDSSSTSTSAGH